MKHTTLELKRAKEDDNAARIRRFGPRPVNPFEQLRTRNGLSLGALAEYSGITIMALSRTEHGLYTNPLPNLVSYWVNRGKASDGELTEEYADFQFFQRKRHERYFGNLLCHDGQEHPFRILRKRRPSLVTGMALESTLSETAQALCVPLDTIQFFEKKWRTQQSVPKTIKEALNVMGYLRSEIRDFETHYQDWRVAQTYKGLVLT